MVVVAPTRGLAGAPTTANATGKQGTGANTETTSPSSYGHTSSFQLLDQILGRRVNNYSKQQQPARPKTPLSDNIAMSTARTAALSRYLAAIDGPAPGSPEQDGAAVAPLAEAAVAEERNPSPSEENANRVNHKVVSSPPKTQEEPQQNQVIARTSTSVVPGSPRAVAGRKRSHSTGRSIQRRTNASRDVVQEVYDRMGVSRDGWKTPTPASASSGDFQERYRAAAALSANVAAAAAARGRQASEESPPPTDGQRRARSLSRGRSVKGQWPPPPSNTEAQKRIRDFLQEEKKCDDPANSSSSFNAFISATTPTRSSSSDGGGGPNSLVLRTCTSFVDAPVTNKGTLKSPTSPPHRYHRSSNSIGSLEHSPSFSSPQQAAGEGNSWKRRPGSTAALSPPPSKVLNLTVETTVDGSLSSTVDENDSSSPAGGVDKGVSVRDRLRQYGGKEPKSGRNFAPQKVYAPHTKRDHPPKIDIYAEGSKQQEKQDPLSPAAAKAADAAAELVRRQQHQQGGKKLAESLYMSKIQSQQQSKAGGGGGVPNVVGTEGIANSPDSGSVALSSVSGDEFGSSTQPTPPPPPPLTTTNKSYQASKHTQSRPTTWADRTHSNTSKFGKPTASAASTSSKSDMERMVDERVQHRVTEVLEREILPKLENRLQKQFQSRLELLENKLDQMLTILASTAAASAPHLHPARSTTGQQGGSGTSGARQSNNRSLSSPYTLRRGASSQAEI